MAKYFMHRIQEDNGAFTKGIEVHENLDDAVRSFWGRMKTGYNNPQNPNITFVSCKITDENGAVIFPYNKTWLKDDEPNAFFLHSIRVDGETVTKAIDSFETQDAAMVAFAAAMEYGYNNPRWPNVSLVSCEITDILSGGVMLENETWRKLEEEPSVE